MYTRRALEEPFVYKRASLASETYTYLSPRYSGHVGESSQHCRHNLNSLHNLDSVLFRRSLESQSIACDGSHGPHMPILPQLAKRPPTRPQCILQCSTVY